MTSTIAPAAFGKRPGFVEALRALPPAALPFFAAAVVFGTVAMASAPATWLDGASTQAIGAPELPSEAGAVVPALTAAQARSRARTRCANCGVVQAIRRIEAVGELSASYEFTVRLHDGSMRVSSDASQAKWRIGDSIMLIGGDRPPA